MFNWFAHRMIANFMISQMLQNYSFIKFTQSFSFISVLNMMKISPSLPRVESFNLHMHLSTKVKRLSQEWFFNFHTFPNRFVLRYYAMLCQLVSAHNHNWHSNVQSVLIALPTSNAYDFQLY